MIAPTSTSTPIPLNTPFVPPTIVAAAPSEQFDSLLTYEYSLPSGWSQVRTENSLVLVDRTGKLTVSISEQVIEPWKYPTILALAAQLTPEEPSGWDRWNLVSKQSVRSGNAHEFRYGGEKNGVEYMNFIHWFMWGDIHVQVSAEVPEFDWNISGSIRSTLSSVLESFEPHDDSRIFTESDVLTILAQRLDDRPSGVFARDDVARARYEMTCRQILTDLVQTPLHFGAGMWQMSAQTLESVETWRVFAPSGSIVAQDTNQSRC